MTEVFKMMFIILINDGVYEGGKVFGSCEEVELELVKLKGNEELLDEDGEVVDFSDLLEYGSMGERLNIYNSNLVEMGNECVSMSVVELFVD